MKAIKSLFTRPSYISKSFYWFLWFTIFAFIVGVTIKVIVAGWEIWMVSDSLPHQADLLAQSKANYANLIAHPDLTDPVTGLKNSVLAQAMVAHGFDPLSEGIKTENYIEAYTGMGLQIAIVIVTVVIYPLAIKKQYRIYSKKEAFTQKAYRSLKIENIVFLSIFLFLDITSIGIVVYEHAPMHGWVLFTIISIIIPTPLVIASMVWMRKLRLAGEVQGVVVK